MEKKICVSIPLTNIKELESIENKIENIHNKDNNVILEFRLFK
jgi:hypothetical protein